jgi:hypothetical protein
MHSKKQLKARNDIMATYRVVEKLLHDAHLSATRPDSFMVTDANSIVGKYANGEPVSAENIELAKDVVANMRGVKLTENSILLPDTLTVTENANLTSYMLDYKHVRDLEAYVRDVDRQAHEPSVVRTIANGLMSDVLSKYFDETMVQILKIRAVMQPLSPMNATKYRKLVVRALRNIDKPKG